MYCGNIQFFSFLHTIHAKWKSEQGKPLNEVEIYLMWKKMSLEYYFDT